MAWVLQFCGMGKWVDICPAVSADAAKIKARQYEIERNTLSSYQTLYRILDPSGSAWLYGTPHYMHNGGIRFRWDRPQDAARQHTTRKRD